MLLASAYHARVDIPAMIEASGADVRQADVLGEDPALLTVLRQRLAEHGVSPNDRDLGVIVMAVGSSNDAANARTAAVAPALGSGMGWAGVEMAFATGPHPNLAEAAARLRCAGATRRGRRPVVPCIRNYHRSSRDVGGCPWLLDDDTRLAHTTWWPRHCWIGSTKPSPRTSRPDPPAIRTRQLAESSAALYATVCSICAKILTLAWDRQ